MRQLASLACCLLLIGCGTLPKGLSPKPDVKPLQESQAKLQTSIGKTREHVSKERESEAKVSESLGKVRTELAKAGDSQAIQDARAALAEAEAQRQVSAQYREWADTELANSWRYNEDAGSQIKILSGQIDAAHENERLAVAAVEKWKPIIDQVNAYWGLGAFAYGFKVLMKHLLVLTLVLGVVGAVVFFVFPAVIPVVIGVFRRVVTTIGSIFKK